MRVLWLCNIVLPELCEEFNLKKTHIGGWLTGLWQELKEKKGLELGICVPIIDEFRRKDGKKDNYLFFSFPFQREENISTMQEKCFGEILEKFTPDIVHIWGTEYHHTWAMVQACKKKGLQENIVINIQGLLSFCYPLYEFGLPAKIIYDNLFGKTIHEEMIDFINRSKSEVSSLENVFHVIGRTDWDQFCIERISKARYHKCGEILRQIFYEDRRAWRPDNCERHSIFISQAGYPIKGLHLVLENIYQLKKKYADLKIFIAGADLYTKGTMYAYYIRTAIEKYNLKETIYFTGHLSNIEMYDYYLRSNVFLSASTEENSPNSICEAMCVGTPVVASYVGGVSSIISHGESGFLYPLTETYMLECYVERIFEDDALAERLSSNGKKVSAQFNNKEQIVERIMNIYELIKDERA